MLRYEKIRTFINQENNLKRKLLLKKSVYNTSVNYQNHTRATV